jgi:uncharacterized protein with ParB-like and HNH nuclease domain
MAQELDKKETVDLRELFTSIIVQEEALVNVLENKGIISKQGLLEEMKRVQASMVKADK